MVDVSFSPDAPGALDGDGPLTGRLWEQTASHLGGFRLVKSNHL